MEIEPKNNHIYFTQEVNNNALNHLPKNVIDYYDLKFYNPSPGCIRTLDNKIIAIYFYVSTNIQDNAIIKFNYIDDDIAFDSIYLRKEKDKAFSNSKEYRYDKDDNLLASYDFYGNSPDHFCIQNKEIKNTKNYTRFKTPKSANKILKESSKKYLTKEITNELLSAFHTTGNEQEIYWLIQ